jgi:P27 family predicted phage terminase small subunit
LKALAGNPGKRAVNRLEPKPTGIPACPRTLDKAARVEWARISKELLTLGLLTSVDRAALAGYCASWSRWVAADLQVQKYGAVIRSPKSNYPVPNPFVSVGNTALSHVLKFATEFGLTPASRSRLHVDASEKLVDPFEKFMAGIGAAEEMTTDEPTQNEHGRTIH